MKGLTMNWIKTLLFLMIAPALTNDTDSCEPVKALFIWHTSSGDDMSFIQGKRLLISVIDGLPQGTDVILKTIGADANIDKQFQKNAKDTTWMNELSIHKPGNSENHVISSNDIGEAVFKYLDQNTSYTPKRAEEVFLIVTDKSVIDNERIVTEALKKKKTFVVVYGELTDVWTNLATDNNHLKELENTTKNVKNTGKSLLELSCKDSSFLCDTDQYWTGERCYRCSYICSSSPSEYCLKKCPHLKHSPQDIDSGVTTPAKDKSDCETNNGVLDIINTCMLAFLCSWMVHKRLRELIKRTLEKIQNFRKRKNEVAKTESNAHGTSQVPAQTSDAAEHLNINKDTVSIAMEEGRSSRSSDENGVYDITASKEPIPDATMSLLPQPPQGANPETMGLLEEND